MGRATQILCIGPLTPSSTLSVDHIRHLDDSIAVLPAGTTSEATEILESQPVDCVIYEPTSEDEAGLDGVRQIQAHDPMLPVFLVLNTPAERTVEAALSAGVTDCVLAPLDDVDRRLLINRIQRAVDTSRKRSSARDSQPPAGSETRVATEADYQSLIEDVLGVSYVGTFVLDADFSVVWINDSIAEYFGVDSDIIGQDKRGLIEGRIKHIFADPDRFADRVIATYDNNTYVERFECHVTPGDGRKDRWLEHWSYPITTGPYAGGRIEHYVDITARKQREQELNDERALLDRLFETSPAGIVLLDSDGRSSAPTATAKSFSDYQSPLSLVDATTTPSGRFTTLRAPRFRAMSSRFQSSNGRASQCSATSTAFGSRMAHNGGFRSTLRRWPQTMARSTA